MDKIKIAIVGVGNSARALIHGIHYYRGKKPGDTIGILDWEIGGYKPGDIEVVAAFDIDELKVGKDVNKAIIYSPNSTVVCQTYIPDAGISVQMGRILNGDSGIKEEYTGKAPFALADHPEPTREEVVNILKETGAEIMMNYVPAGSEDTTKFYAYCALEAGVSFVNNTPVCIAGNPLWALRFEYNNIPIIGDNVKPKFPYSYSINLAGLGIDSIRCAKLALNRSQGGVLLAPSAYFCKSIRSIYNEVAFNIIGFINDEEGF
ncbi:MAG: hypothetical protein ACYSTS_18200 [Planctomycetota bacterium]|jgi:myo-inositol-1-phosphate synthase